MTLTRGFWLPQLPPRWAVSPAKSLFGNRTEPSHDDDVHLTPSQKYGVLTQEAYMEVSGSSVVLNLTGSDRMRHVEPDDFIIHLRSFQGGIERSELRGKVSMAYTVLAPRRPLVPRFYQYLMKSAIYVGALGSTTDQLRDGQSIKHDGFARLDLPEPPPGEQQAIADFLDRETAQIDAMIEANDALASQLNARRDSLIHGVLNGMEPGPRVPLKHAVRYQEGPGIMAADFREEGTPLLRVSCVKGGTVTLEGCNYLDPGKVRSTWSHFRVKRGDLLISASASMGSVSEVVADEVVGSIPYTGIIKITPTTMTKDYARWFFRSPDFMRQVIELRTGSTLQHFGPSHLGQMNVCLPDRQEQDRRSQVLNHESARMDAVIAEAARVTALLRERREALITAAVTGRIDPHTGIERLEDAS